METKIQRAARRMFSSWLTKQINTPSFHNYLGSEIRSLVLQTLEKTNVAIKNLNKALSQDFALRSDEEYVRFYMKGGNAFECVMYPYGDAAQKKGGGTSDWDTQIVIDPWLPPRIQETIYGKVEDLIWDQLSQASLDVSLICAKYVYTVADENVEKAIIAAWHKDRGNIGDYDASSYDLSLDSPQTFRKIYNHEKQGLWLNDSSNLANKQTKYPQWISGISFNDAIAPFILYRMGYTWHASALSGAPVTGNDLYQAAGDITKPLLMELIDVTIPRRNTVEAIEVWKALEQDHFNIVNTAISVTNANGQVISSSKIPLPSIRYHLSEILEMLCEIADGSSVHKDKLPKRLQRFVDIWLGYPTERQAIDRTLCNRMGIAHLSDVNELEHGIQSYNSLIQQYIVVTLSDNQWASLKEQMQKPEQEMAPQYQRLRKLIIHINQCSFFRQDNFVDGGRINSKLVSSIQHDWNTFTSSDIAIQAIKNADSKILNGKLQLVRSDDLTLLDLIYEQGYLEPSRIGFSGINKAVIGRVSNNIELKYQIAAIQEALSSQQTSQSANTAILKSTINNATTPTYEYKLYNVDSPFGFFYECIFVLFTKGKADRLITLTTGNKAQVPFQPSPNNYQSKTASLVDIGRQRKVAAALIDDYSIRSVLSKQYDAVKQLT